MCSAPWSASAWITISAPVISVIGRSTRLNWSVVWSGNQKGPSKAPGRASPRSWADLAAPGDALPKYGNKIAHGHALPAESCATLAMLQRGVKRKTVPNPQSGADSGRWQVQERFECRLRRHPGPVAQLMTEPGELALGIMPRVELGPLGGLLQR